MRSTAPVAEASDAPALTFQRALGANVLASASGMAMQAATAPLLLLALRVDQYAQWILVTAICSYLSLALNGPFYALLNEITLAAGSGSRRRAEAAYALGLIAVVALLAGAASALAAVLGGGAESLGASALPLCLGLLAQAAGFAAILFDAQFRAIGRYRFGTNVLTIGRVLDWAVSIALAFLLADVTRVFAGLALYKIVQTLAMAGFVASRPGSLSLKSARPSPGDAARWLGAARSQLVLSASAAATAMGPQIVVGLAYDAVTLVAFSTARTYLRLLAAGINVLSAAAWPVLTAMYARRDVGGMRAFMARLLARGVGLAVVGGLVLVALAGPVFALAFRGKVAADRATMLLILASVVVNGAIAIEQTLFVSTNLPSRGLAAGLLVTLASLLFMAAAAHRMPFDAVLAGQVAFDVLGLWIVHRAASTALSRSTP